MRIRTEKILPCIVDRIKNKKNYQPYEEEKWATKNNKYYIITKFNCILRSDAWNSTLISLTFNNVIFFIFFVLPSVYLVFVSFSE